MATTMNAHIVEQPGADNQHTVDLHIDNPDVLGGGGEQYTLPAATTSAIGGVKKASAVSAVVAADSAAAAGDTVAKAEFDKLVTEANETKKQLNALIAAGKSAGWLAKASRKSSKPSNSTTRGWRVLQRPVFMLHQNKA